MVAHPLAAMRPSANLRITQKIRRRRRLNVIPLKRSAARQHLRVLPGAPARSPGLLQVRLVPTSARARNLVTPHVANENPDRKTKDQNSADRHVEHGKCPPKSPRFARQPFLEPRDDLSLPARTNTTWGRQSRRSFGIVERWPPKLAIVL